MIKILSLFILVLSTISRPRVIALGEIKIQGDVDKPSVSFIIPRARFDFFDTKGFLDKRNSAFETTESVKNRTFKTQ